VTAVVFRLGVRSLMRGRRPLVVAALALIPVVAAVGQRVGGEVDPVDAFAALLGDLLIPTVTAFVAVILAASSIGEDREDGTILQLVATMVPRSRLALAKILASWATALAVLLPATLATAAVALGGDVGLAALAWPLLAVALTALAYASAFVWVALLTRRAILVGAVYVLLWEGTLGTFADGIDRLSVAAYGRAVAARGVDGVDAPPVSATVGVLVLVGVAVAGWVLAARALDRTELP